MRGDQERRRSVRRPNSEGNTGPSRPAGTDKTKWHGHRHIGENPQGRDFVAGDIHGMFGALQEALDACGFDESRDHLLSVGDLIDRGHHSEEALAWIESGRIHAATLGNHEAMMLRALFGPNEDIRARAHAFWRENGGEWWDEAERNSTERQQWREALQAMPLAITLDTAQGPVGIVHALPLPGPWSETVEQCRSDDDAARYRALWGTAPSREQDAETEERRSDDEPRAIITGHFPCEAPHRTGNIVHIDTGAGLDIPSARVTLACVSTKQVTFHSSPAGGARAIPRPAGDGPEGDNAALWLTNAAARKLERWWHSRNKHGTAPETGK